MENLVPWKSNFLPKLNVLLFWLLNFNVLGKVSLIFLLLRFHPIIAHTLIATFTLTIKLILCGK